MPEGDTSEVELIATTKLRWALRKNGMSGNPSLLTVLQVWWSNGIDGQWRDVPFEMEEEKPNERKNT